MNLQADRKDSFGIYVHIPYCLQICPYCDFAKYEVGKIPDQNHYTELLLKEIRQKNIFISKEKLTSVYFGGGTPSIMSVENMRKILDEIRHHFRLSEDIEITIEINPGNIDEKKLNQLLEMGVNRFSVGSQTFDDNLLDIIGRKHSAEETAETLRLLNKYDLNFSMDILFSLPHQTLEILKKDLMRALEYNPRHISTYYLNVPESNRLSENRADDETQVHMFKIIEQTLKENNVQRYEISNYAVPEFESKHNLIYWNDQPYWGIGLSAHSFLKHPPWGIRFFNPKSYSGYESYIASLSKPQVVTEGLKESRIEVLEEHQSMTEFCYTSLRKMSGLNLDHFFQKYSKIPRTLSRELLTLQSRNLLLKNGSVYQLSDEGKILSNLVFERLTFLKEDLY